MRSSASSHDRGRARRRDPLPLAIGAIGLALAAWVGTRLWVPDLGLHYPFPGGDGHDWISNALALLGEPVRYTGRPPGFALLLAALEATGASSLLPFLQQAALVVLALLAYFALRSRDRVAAATVALFVLTAETLQRHALDVMAEPLAITFLAGACVAFLTARERPRRYVIAGILGGLAALTQPATALFLPAAGATMLRFRRVDLWRREAWLGGAAFAILAGGWLAAKAIVLGASGFHSAAGWKMLRPHLEVDALGYYANAALVLCGWPALALLAVAATRALTRVVRRGGGRDVATPDRFVEARWLTGLVGAALLVFFLFVYDFRAERFLLYAMVPGLWWMGDAIAAVRPVAVRVAIGATVLLLAAWPSPSFAAHPWVDVARFARQDHRFETIDRERFAGASSVVYLERPGAPYEGRYRPLYRLGNALRKRVKVAPAAIYPRDWWGWDCLGPGDEVDEYVLLPWACAGAPTRVVVALSRRHPQAPALRDRASRASPAGSAFPSEAADAWERARRLEAEVRERDGFLVAYFAHGPRAEWLRALPFVARTTSLFILRPTRNNRAVLEDALLLAEWNVAGCALRRTRRMAQEITMIVSCDAD